MDDDPPVARAMAASIRSIDGIEVCGEAHNFEEATAAVRKERPHLVLMDIDLGNARRDGLDIAAAIKSEAPQTNVVLFSAHEHPRYLKRAMEQRVQGYLLKGDKAEVFKEGIKRAAEGKPVFSPRIRELMEGIGFVPSGESQTDDKVSLTAREKAVMQMMGEDYTVEQTARLLEITAETVRTLRRRALDKLGLEAFHGFRQKRPTLD